MRKSKKIYKDIKADKPITCKYRTFKIRLTPKRDVLYLRVAACFEYGKLFLRCATYTRNNEEKTLEIVQSNRKFAENADFSIS